MDPAAERALARLRAEDGLAIRELAKLVVDKTTDTPIGEIASARWISSQITTALEAATRGDQLRESLSARLDKGRERWAHDERALSHWISDDARKPLRTLVGRPWSPSESATEHLVNQPQVRNLLSQVLEDAVRRFGTRMRNFDQGLGGIGKRAAKRGRTFGKGLLAAAGVRDVASDMVHAMSSEFEAALDKRVKEFTGEATTRAMRTIVQQLSDPEFAQTFADFRVGLLDELLDTPLKDLIDEVENLEPMDAVDVVLQAVRSAVSQEDFVERTAERVQQALDEAGDGTLGAWLEEIDLLDVWTETTIELVTGRLQAVVQTDGFETWWSSLFDQ
ncbi:MAG: hypothetical protein ACI9MC_003769 [Kiritimatiellia bacterium]|jgi:hypothetical protein